jgi:hypothetical protein
MYCRFVAGEILSLQKFHNREEKESRIVLRDQDNEGWAGSSFPPGAFTFGRNTTSDLMFPL